MAGYADDYSKSNNALDAEDDGQMVASKLARYAAGRWRRLRGITASDIEDVLSPASWHHTSKMYNEVNYFDPEDLRERGVRGRLCKLATARRATQKRPPVTLEGCTVEWLDWGGTSSRPKPTEMREEGCAVTFKPGRFMVEVVFESGKKMRKLFDTRGFDITDSHGSILWRSPADCPADRTGP